MPRIAKGKNLVVWLGTPSTEELTRLGHKIISVDTYDRGKKVPIKLAFTLPVKEDETEDIRHAKDLMVNQACWIIEKEREIDGKFYSYEARRDVKTYANLWLVCDDAWKEATDHIEGRYFKYITVMVFSAFCLEAYLNHIGRMYYSKWYELEKKISPRKKLEMILEKLGMSPDFGSRPFQTFQQIFYFRDQIAHGKTEYLHREGMIKITPEENIPLPHSEWELLVSEPQAKIFMDDADEIIRTIHTQAGFSSHHFDLGSSSWGASESNKI